VWESPAAAKIFCCARNAESSDKTRAGAAILSSEPAADAARANRAGVERGNGGAPTAAISWNRGNPVREVVFGLARILRRKVRKCSEATQL